ncbi:hypothetical protein [Thalassotalea hakodatensis]|uniref:hypothetical protein n=1 Tax=Thalassotalea hakodatensis TaxID=3030492 RepID=UPI002572DD19|nr:hypothetical protein [Thalassotalea hakodatensis]
MTEQVSLWQDESQSADFAELCCALYEREITSLSRMQLDSASAIQGRLKSLSYYVKRTASSMLQTKTPLTLDIQNASWSAKQSIHPPLAGQETDEVNQWYLSAPLTHGLVVPVADKSRIMLDSIDRIDMENQRFRTNTFGWFTLDGPQSQPIKLLKPNKKVMTAACTGHTWLNDQKTIPTMPTLRELLLSCAINWRNFKQTLTIKP